MRAGLLFLAIGLAMLGFAGHGLISDGVFAFQRHSDALILREEQPFWYTATVAAYVIGGTLMMGLSALFFCFRHKEKQAETRFFRQRDSLQ